MSTSHEKQLYLSIMESLERQFAQTVVITRAQFRELMKFSPSTDTRMYNAKEYPNTIKVHGEERILLTDLALFLAGLPSGRELNRPRPYTKNPKPQKSVSVQVA